MNNIWVLRPNREPVYGQDYFIEGIKTKCKDNNVFVLSDYYNLSCIESGDVVVTHNPDDKKDYDVFKKLSIRQDIILVSHFHCHPAYYDKENSERVKEVIKLSRHIVCPFKYNDIPWFENTKVDATPNAIPIIDFKPITESPYKWASRAPIIGHVGRLETAKGLQLIAEFARTLNRLNAYFVIQFQSKDVYLSRAISIQALNPERIYLHPDIDRRLPRPVKWFDICVSFSLSEFAPLVVLESLMAGTPVVATDATAFYDELKFNLGDNFARCLKTITLPDRLNRGDIARSDAILSYNEVNSMAQGIFTAVKETLSWKKEHDGNLRRDLSSFMAKSKYESNAAYDACLSLYRSYIKK